MSGRGGIHATATRFTRRRFPRTNPRLSMTCSESCAKRNTDADGQLEIQRYLAFPTRSFRRGGPNQAAPLPRDARRALGKQGQPPLRVEDSEAWGMRRLLPLNQEGPPPLGRPPSPMIPRQADAGFTRISWEEAFDFACKAIRDAPPHQMAFFATSRGLTNEVYYVFQKLARVLGTNNVDLCSRLCHAASVSGLKATLGVGAPTCSLSDFIGTDLLVIFGSALANNQPVTTKYMHFAKKKGTRIVVVNPMREYGLERYWVPSAGWSALFGTKLMDDFFQVRVGGDIAFINGALKALIETDRLARDFITGHTRGFDQLEAPFE